MSGSESKYPTIDRLYKILNFWENTHYIKAIHMGREMRRALTREVCQPDTGSIPVLASFGGYPIEVCDIIGCDDGVTLPCASIVVGEPLEIVQSTWRKTYAGVFSADRYHNEVLSEQPPEGLVWE